MKNIKLLSLLSLLAIATIFVSSCGPTEEVAPKPVLEFLGGSEYVSGDISLSAETDFTVGIIGTHVSKMTGINITVSYDGGAELTPANCTLCDSTIDTKDLNVNFYGKTGTTAGSEVWSFTLTDKDGESTTKTITITNLGAPGATLQEFTQDNQNNPFRVWNFHGTKAGAYQLGVGSISSNEPNSLKDIQDSTTTGEISTWPGRWTSRNGSMFKKTTTHTWTNMNNVTELEAAWNSLGDADAVINPAEDDVYIVNIKNAGTFALVEITGVVETSGDNNDYVQFIYKK
jgi:hypothetical protein